MEPTPLQHLLHKKGWRLIHLYEELKKRNTPVSYPILLRIKNGFRTVNGKIVPYEPSRRTLANIASIFKVDKDEIYQDRSHE